LYNYAPGFPKITEPEQACFWPEGVTQLSNRHVYFILECLSSESAEGRPVDADLLVKVKQLELDGVEAAEKGDVAKAEQLFTEVIELMPQRASGYNNRAQARRLLDNVAGKYRQRSLYAYRQLS
jgi:hypothetical protein